MTRACRSVRSSFSTSGSTWWFFGSILTLVLRAGGGSLMELLVAIMVGVSRRGIGTPDAGAQRAQVPLRSDPDLERGEPYDLRSPVALTPEAPPLIHEGTDAPLQTVANALPQALVLTGDRDRLWPVRLRARTGVPDLPEPRHAESPTRCGSPNPRERSANELDPCPPPIIIPFATAVLAFLFRRGPEGRWLSVAGIGRVC